MLELAFRHPCWCLLTSRTKPSNSSLDGSNQRQARRQVLFRGNVTELEFAGLKIRSQKCELQGCDRLGVLLPTRKRVYLRNSQSSTWFLRCVGEVLLPWVLDFSCFMPNQMRSTVNWISTSDTQRGCAFTRISLRLECTFPAGLGWVKQDGPTAFPLPTDWSCCLPQERARKTDLVFFFGCFTFQKEQLSGNTRKQQENLAIDGP